MARKHLQEQYNKVLSSYLDMLELLDECQDTLKSDSISDTQRRNLEMMMAPIKASYQQMSWIMYLMNMPERPGKLTRYEKQLENKMKRTDPNGDFSFERMNELNEDALSDIAHQLLNYKEEVENSNNAQEDAEEQIREWAVNAIKDGKDEEVKATLGTDEYNVIKALVDEAASIETN